MEKRQRNLAIIFGGKSSEHEVSIITAFQAWNWISQQKFKCYWIYLDQQNHSFLCPPFQKNDPQRLIERILKQKNPVNFIKSGIELKQGLIKRRITLDAVLLLTHGGTGEDGELQGTLDFFDIPYTGSNVLGSALGMDKAFMKDVLSKKGLAVAPYFYFCSREFENNPKKIIGQVEEKIGYPVFVKPSSGGSSIGISRARNKKELTEAIKSASVYDFRILIEKGIEGAVDINCAVMGGDNPTVSVCEQPISEDKFLSFREKYLKGGKGKGMAGLSRIIPAPIPEKADKEIKELAKVIFREIAGWGMARVDFLYQKKTGRVYPNEINTIPGSLAYYLWEASGLKPPQLVEEMIALAQERKKRVNKLKYSFKSEILNQK